jgi:hypothetical protein
MKDSPLQPEADGGVRVQRMVRPLACCTQCGGSGRTPIGTAMWNTLLAVDDYGVAGVCAEDLAKMMKWRGHPTAINNRLAYLWRLGFLKREKHGRFWFYTVVERSNNELSGRRPLSKEKPDSGTPSAEVNGWEDV